MNPPSGKSEHEDHHANAKAMARTCYREAVDAAVKILKHDKAKHRDRALAALVIVIAAEWRE